MTAGYTDRAPDGSYLLEDDGLGDVEVPQPATKGYCRNCARAWVYESQVDYGVVSPTGLMHIGCDYGVTACGVDATGPTWWWRS